MVQSVWRRLAVAGLSTTFVLTTATALAQTEAEAQSVGKEACAFEASVPVMPEKTEVSKPDYDAARQSVLTYQAALKDYRACLDDLIETQGTVMRDKGLGDQARRKARKARKSAIEAFNATVDQEQGVVEAWNAFASTFDAQN